MVAGVDLRMVNCEAVSSSHMKSFGALRHYVRRDYSEVGECLCVSTTVNWYELR